MVKQLLSSRRPSAVSLVLPLLLAVVLLYFAFRGVAWGEMLATARQGRLELFALACGIMTVSTALRALRWRVLLSAEKLIPPLTVFWATAVGYLGNNFLPARAGEVIRSVMLGRAAGVSKSYILATALTERIMDVIALLLISVGALLTLRNVPDWLFGAARVMALVGAVGLVGLLVAPRLQGLIQRLVGRLPLPPRFRSRVQHFIGQFLLGTEAFQHVGRALGFAGLTVVIWSMDTLAAVVTARALRLDLAVPVALLLLAGLGLSSAAPSTPGYLGIYQFVARTILPAFGFTQEQALVYIIVFQALTYVIVVVWGLLGLWRLSVGTPGSARPDDEPSG